MTQKDLALYLIYGSQWKKIDIKKNFKSFQVF
jgi:hypothetical protein